MTRSTLFMNLLRRSLSPHGLSVLIRKIGRRVHDERGTIDDAANEAWIRAHVEDFASWAAERDPALLTESQDYAARLRERATEILGRVPYRLSGGGHYMLLHFLTRLLGPEYIVETGVAAGFSSCAFLEALERNGSGRLFSSDFPAMRVPHGEQYTGILVPPALKADWTLYTDGDRTNLRRIVRQIPRVDLFHYDSDKTYSGRRYALRQVEPLLQTDSVVVMDDIHNNAHFHDLVVQRGTTDFWVFEFEGKYLGVIGSVLSRADGRAGRSSPA